MQISLPKITDPTVESLEIKTSIGNFFTQFIRDERDLPFIYLCIKITCLLLPLIVLLFIPTMFSIWVALLYWVLLFGLLLGPFTLMLHNTSHQKFFKPEYDSWNYLIPWFIGPMMGQSPETYFGHHIGMHHAEGNMHDDLSTTLPYQRDSFRGFLHYYFTFLFTGFVALIHYFKRTKKKRFLKGIIRGEFSYLIFAIIMLFVNWKATLVVFIIPFVLVRFLMMAGNWAQHAFIDLNDPKNSYKNSLTCINSRYNRICFNDGYHIGHHVKPNLHWSEMPTDFQKNIEKYATNEAVIFENLDFFMVWFLLMTKQYQKLAAHFVDLTGRFSNQKEIVLFLKTRLQKEILSKSN